MRGKIAVAALIVAVLVATLIYVVRTTDHPVAIQVGGAATAAFDKKGAVAPGNDRALFSPDGSRLALLGLHGVGLAENGQYKAVTANGSNAVDGAWMPDSRSMLIAEGPALMERLSVLNLDGSVKGSVGLQIPFSAGAGSGMAVDSRGVRAVMVSELRDSIGGRRRLDLVLVDLLTGQVRKLTDTPDADEAWPLFADDNRVIFGRTEAGGPSAVFELDLATLATRRLSPVDEEARPVGVIRSGLVYAGGNPGGGVTVWFQRTGAARQRLAGIPAGSIVWSVDPGATRVVASVVTITPAGERLSILRAVTLQAP